MIIDDLWTASGPCKRDVRILEQLEDRRALIEAFRPPQDEDGGASQLRAHLLATLDTMEEALCLYGPNARALTLGRQTLDLLEPRLFESARREPPARPEPRDRPDSASIEPALSRAA